MKRDVPEGWIRTPLPPMPREDLPEQSWFARTGEPAPERIAPEPEATSTGPLARAVLITGLLFAGAVALGSLYLWSL